MVSTGRGDIWGTPVLGDATFHPITLVLVIIIITFAAA